MKRSGTGSIVVLVIISAYLLLPFAVTFIYSLFRDWTSVLPRFFTLDNYRTLITDCEFWASVGRTLIICVVSVILTIAVLLMVMYVSCIKYQKLEKYVQFFCMIPYALQGVILSISIVSIYSGTGTLFSNRMVMLFGAYSVMVLPYIYQGIRNNLNSINCRVLLQSAQMLNCSEIKAYVMIIIPNIMPGITVSALLAQSLIFGDFVLANNIAGNNYKNIQVYLYSRMFSSSGLSSAIVVVIFLIVFIMSAAVLQLKKMQRSGGNGVY